MQDGERVAFARQTQSRQRNASSCRMTDKARANILQRLATTNLRMRANSRVSLMGAEGPPQTAHCWLLTVTESKLPKALPRARVMKRKLMANLRMACKLFVCHNLHMILTNLSFIVETIKNHRIDKNVTVFRKAYGSCVHD